MASRADGTLADLIGRSAAWMTFRRRIERIQGGKTFHVLAGG